MRFEWQKPQFAQESNTLYIFFYFSHFFFSLRFGYNNASNKYNILQCITCFISSLDVLPMFPQEFEKDDDSNGHIDFITSASVRLQSCNTPIRHILSYDLPPPPHTTPCNTFFQYVAQYCSTLLKPCPHLSGYFFRFSLPSTRFRRWWATKTQVFENAGLYGSFGLRWCHT